MFFEKDKLKIFEANFQYFYINKLRCNIEQIKTFILKFVSVKGWMLFYKPKLQTYILIKEIYGPGPVFIYFLELLLRIDLSVKNLS